MFHDVSFSQTLRDDTVHDLVADQAAGLHDGFGLLAELGARSDSSAEHVARRHVNYAVRFNKLGTLRAFPRSLTSKDNNSTRHSLTFQICAPFKDLCTDSDRIGPKRCTKIPYLFFTRKPS